MLSDPAIGGFEVTSVVNRPAHEVALAVEDFFSDRAADDLLLVHFSCHGVKDESGELYFAMPDTRLRRLAATGVSAAFVNRQMVRSRSRRVVLFLDCCYAGAFERGLVHRSEGGVGVESQLGGRGRAVVTASSALEYAFEGDVLTDSPSADESPSIFTRALVSGLESGDADRDQDGLISLDELYDHIYDSVRASTPHQTPGKWVFGVEGELVIARSGRPVSRAIPRPAPPIALPSPPATPPPSRPAKVVHPVMRRLVAAGVVALVGAVALAWWWLAGDGRATPADEKALLAGVPSSIQDQCGDFTTDSQGRASVSCEGGRLVYTLAGSVGEADELVGSAQYEQCDSGPQDPGGVEMSRYSEDGHLGTLRCTRVDTDTVEFLWHDDAAPLVIARYRQESGFDDARSAWVSLVTAG